MKQEVNPFEEAEADEEAYHQDIVNMLIQLRNKDKVPPSQPQMATPTSGRTKRADNPPISEESDFCSTSLRQLPSPKPRKTHKIDKNTRHHHRSESRKAPQGQKSLEMFGIQSAPDESAGQKQSPPKQGEVALSKLKARQNRLKEKEEELQAMTREYQTLQAKFIQRQQEQAASKQEQISRLSIILAESYTRRMTFQSLMELDDSQRQLAVRQNHENSCLIAQYLRNQEARIKPKPKKSKKNMSMSDEEENKLSESVAREKMPFLSVVANKLQKQVEKYGLSKVSQSTQPIKIVSQGRLQALNKLPGFANIKILCCYEDPTSSIQTILGLDLEKLQEVLITCWKFSPMASYQRRKQIHLQLIGILSSNKKIMASSTHLIFTQKCSLFVPLTVLHVTSDEVMLVNEHNGYVKLTDFMSRMELSSNELMSVTRYIVRVAIKGIQQVTLLTNTKHMTVLPSNIVLNQKCEVKLKNIVFNDIFQRQFRHLTNSSHNESAFFPPEDRPDPNHVSLWSIGVLTHYLCFGSFPFANYQPFSCSNREEFLLVHQLECQAQTAAQQRCRDFVQLCLSKKGPVSFGELCSDPFFSSGR